MKVVKLFGAAWCSGCKAQKQMLEAKEVEFEYIDIDTDEGAAEASKYKVRSLPTTVIERDGVVSRVMVGVQTVAEVEAE